MLFPSKPFFLSCGDNLTIDDQSRGASAIVVVEGRYSKDCSQNGLYFLAATGGLLRGRVLAKLAKLACCKKDGDRDKLHQIAMARTANMVADFGRGKNPGQYQAQE